MLTLFVASVVREEVPLEVLVVGAAAAAGEWVFLHKIVHVHGDGKLSADKGPCSKANRHIKELGTVCLGSLEHGFWEA